ncbi:MAG: bifunctional diaminohydroxyphosphoribosylaminopyrimidine deaminase/5-amino-6-(5-phosphoribosylamino)uracil reductase RibD [Gemmataceae bacterium]|nr:bifunctional diaminohydroxyphosphoribosylaminopyrimidine deaminase/5-amino-6-(5-phosphoribosylamino)uracil reductase RibD [Gemmataceae bacterium]
MALALELARRGEGWVEPNPMVGAVVVKHGSIVGAGWHRKFGGPHAEVEALSNAGENAQGATLYVTLEPCCHQGKTPPCTEAILQAGIAKVVAPCADPNPKVSTKGFEILKSRQVEVVTGVLEEEARNLLRPFIKFITQGKPFVLAKWAMSVDGKIATASGESRWISNDLSRQKVHQLRGRMDAIVVGAGTVEKDDPELTVRPSGIRTPIRVVLDTHGRINLESKLVQTAQETPTLIVLGNESPTLKQQSLISRGCRVLLNPLEKGRIAPGPLLKELAGMGLQNILIEGGNQVLGAFFDAGEVDEIHVFLAPFVIGGAAALSPVGGSGISSLLHKHSVNSFACDQLGDNLYFRGRLKARENPSCA